jgi:hypothetical protein
MSFVAVAVEPRVRPAGGDAAAAGPLVTSNAMPMPAVSLEESASVCVSIRPYAAAYVHLRNLRIQPLSVGFIAVAGPSALAAFRPQPASFSAFGVHPPLAGASLVNSSVVCSSVFAFTPIQGRSLCMFRIAEHTPQSQW